MVCFAGFSALALAAFAGASFRRYERFEQCGALFFAAANGGEQSERAAQTKGIHRVIIPAMKPKPAMFRGAVIRPSGKAAQSLPPAGEARVRVGREVAGRSGKGVSVITGLPLTATDLEALATKLKKACGAGGAVKDGKIEIQGDHRDRLVDELKKLGYDAKRSGG